MTSAAIIKLIEGIERKLSVIALQAKDTSDRAQQTLAQVHEAQKDMEEIRKNLYASAQTQVLPTPNVSS